MDTLEQLDARLAIISSLSHDELVELAAAVSSLLHDGASELARVTEERDAVQKRVDEGLAYFGSKLIHPANAWILRQLDHAFTVGVPASTGESFAISRGTAAPTANGHSWPCTRFYRTSTPSDKCTCEAAAAAA